LEQIAAAKTRGIKVNRAVRAASFSAWTLGIFGALTLLGGLLSVDGIIIGVGLCVVAYFEFQGAARLKRLDPLAPRRLAINQLALAALLFIYGTYGLWGSLHAPSELSSLSTSDVQELKRQFPDLMSMETPITIAVYVAVIAVAMIGPGLTAIYYHTRTKYIEAYLRETPQWILDLQRAGMSL
jgi:hypothetical protein